MIDARGIPTHECPECGFNVFRIKAWFEHGEVAGYMLDAECDACDSKVTAPTPLDVVA